MALFKGNRKSKGSDLASNLDAQLASLSLEGEKQSQQDLKNFKLLETLGASARLARVGAARPAAAPLNGRARHATRAGRRHRHGDLRPRLPVPK